MKIFFISLGCDKNKVDSEKILDFFITKYDAEIVNNVNDAEIAIVNTCAFIADAKKESINVIKRLYKKKQAGIIKKIMVLGCLVKENELYNIPKFQINKYADVSLSVDKYLRGLDTYNYRILDVVNYSRPIKIADGCFKNCSYCIIPKIRGIQVSRRMEDIVNEAEQLANNGCVELDIVAQDILSYGIDLYHKKSIIRLLDKLSNIDRIKWIRLFYCYPEGIDDEFINYIKTNDKILKYIDMPIQHINDRILRLMNRATSKTGIIEKIYKLRVACENIAIRTTLMVGFPSETDDDIFELIDFIERIRFNHIGCFCYSRERLSNSYSFDNQIINSIKLQRKQELMRKQYDIVLDYNIHEINNVYTVLIDGYDTRAKKYIGRNYKNAKNIDSKIYVDSINELMSGSFVKVQIYNYSGYDLFGRVVDNEFGK